MHKGKRKFLIGRGMSVVFLLTLFLCFSRMSVFAVETDETKESIVSSRTDENSVCIYVRGAGDVKNATIQIGNILCEQTEPTPIGNLEIPIKTTILFDNSQSVSKRWGEQSKQLIKSIIDGHADGEEFRLISFTDKQEVLSDFSTEYDALNAQIDEIESIDCDSYLTDVLYELLQDDRDTIEANFARYIIISDGADDKDIKYTQTELMDLMKNCGVVIHTIGVKTSSNNNLLETFFSYARYTGGIHCFVDSNVAVDDVSRVIGDDYRISCFRIEPNAGLADGSWKEAKLEWETSTGKTSLQTSLKMPFGGVQTESNEVEEETVVEEVESSVPARKYEIGTIVTENESKAEKSKAEETETGILVLVFVGIVCLLFILAVVLIIILFAVKSGNGKYVERGSPARISNPPSFEEWVVLTDVNDARRVFRAPIISRIVIGRSEGEIQLSDDATVSRMHCEIVKIGNLYYVDDLQSANGTFYQEMRIVRRTPVMSGGILRVGRSKYRITFVKYS